jgi:hypothetical protein
MIVMEDLKLVLGPIEFSVHLPNCLNWLTIPFVALVDLDKELSKNSFFLLK